MTSVAQVVPQLPTFAVDDGFAYAIPDGLENVTIGSLVRVPLGNRRVRGHVVDIRAGDVTGLKSVITVSGDWPRFDRRLLETLRWAALHYVAPLAGLLGRTGPPNLPRGGGRAPSQPIDEVESPAPLVSATAAGGGYARPVFLAQTGPYVEQITGLIAPVLAASRNVAIIAPTFEEATRLAGELVRPFGDRVLRAASALPARDVTRAWSRLQAGGGNVIVGTPEIALWPAGDLGMWVIVEEGRRAMKAKQTPTLHVREVIRRRAAIERTSTVFMGPVPTVPLIARGIDLREPPGRVWPLVEIADRSGDGPASRVIGPVALRAIEAVAGAGGQVFVFVARRGYAAAFRCVRCRALRKCPSCGAGPDKGNRCRRCGTLLGPCAGCGGRRFEPLGAGVGRVIEELDRRPGGSVGPAGSGSQLLVGTERDIPAIPPAALSVAVDADGLLLAPHYRAEEDALHTLARVAATVARGGGHRCIIQSNQPGHRVLDALRQGRAGDLLTEIASERAADELPPAVELIALEIRGDTVAIASEVEDLVAGAAEVHGPETVGERTRWFIQSRSLHAVRVRMRPAVQRWRDAGLKVRIDADPVDL